MIFDDFLAVSGARSTFPDEVELDPSLCSSQSAIGGPFRVSLGRRGRLGLRVSELVSGLQVEEVQEGSVKER